MLPTYRLMFDPLLRRIRETLPEFAGMPAGASVLDVCCGTGAQLFQYARKSLRATGIDFDPGMLHQAEYYHRSADFNIVQGDASHLPFSDGCFDFASVSLALHDKDPVLQDAILGEMKRVVRKEGGLVFLDYAAPLTRNLTGGFIRLIESIAGGAHRCHFWSYLRAGGLPAVVKRTGLSLVREVRLGEGALLLLKCVAGVCQEPPPS
jgi:ubiquinone/menaquinone biosynthesis C-methylase UbiE